MKRDVFDPKSGPRENRNRISSILSCQLLLFLLFLLPPFPYFPHLFLPPTHFTNSSPVYRSLPRGICHKLLNVYQAIWLNSCGTWNSRRPKRFSRFPLTFSKNFPSLLKNRSFQRWICHNLLSVSFYVSKVKFYSSFEADRFYLFLFPNFLDSTLIFLSRIQFFFFFFKKKFPANLFQTKTFVRER